MTFSVSCVIRLCTEIDSPAMRFDLVNGFSSGTARTIKKIHEYLVGTRVQFQMQDSLNPLYHVPSLPTHPLSHADAKIITLAVN